MEDRDGLEGIFRSDADADADAAGARVAKGKKRGRWVQVFAGNRGLWITAGVAIIALVGGLVLERFVISPLDAAAGEGAPDPGLVTVPVEFGALSNDITLRGDIAYADSVEVTLDASAFDGPDVVTGQVPKVGAKIDQLSVVLEVAGRPVIALPGKLPSYRTLQVGASGPDVVQLKEALKAVGIDGGDPSNNVFDEQTAGAVGALYEEVGYTPPEPPEGTDQAVRAAEDGLRLAEQSLADAQAALDDASKGASDVEIKEADNQVASLERQIEDMKKDGQDTRDLEDQLAVAEMRRAELDKAPDTSAEQTAVDRAYEAVEEANEDLAEARRAALPFLAPNEVLYLEELPRRVDSVAVKRGATLSGAAMTVSGATVRVTGSVSQADVELLEVGDEATLELPDGTPHPAVIAKIETSDDDGEQATDDGEQATSDRDQATVVFEPAELTPEQIESVQGENVRINIPVGATDGDVLSVPYAALTAGAGGESRVEVVVGDPREGADAETRLVVVETGLAADGYVEVTPVEGELAESDLVVVGS